MGVINYKRLIKKDKNLSAKILADVQAGTLHLQELTGAADSFQYTADDIKADFKKNGKSLILDKITAEKKMGGCDCAEKNPKGK